MVSGDDVAVERRRSRRPTCAASSVKRAINMRAVEARPLAERVGRSRQAAKEAVAGREAGA